MPLTAEQVATFWRTGYVIVPKLFSESDVERIKTLAHEIVAESKDFEVNSADAYDGKQLKDGYVVFRTKDDKRSLLKVAWAAGIKPELLKYGRDVRITQALEPLLDSSTADHLTNQLHYKFPNEGVEFPWHQDELGKKRFDSKWEDINLNGSFVQTIAAIDPCTLDNGPIYVMPSSHLWGSLSNDFATTELLQAHLDKEEIKSDVQAEQVPLIMSPGDVAFLHARLVHASWPNTSAHSRLMFLNGYSYPGANHREYPGKGSTKRINLKTGEEAPEVIKDYPELKRQKR
jgi:ectoine hydroxylase-related dioxygenase (phytanoyl-CoA dioxygenase family)